jgi:predicted aspartyl protease
MTTVSYTSSRRFSGNRPYGEVILRGPTGSTPKILALVDTGADYLQLPASAASTVGLSLKVGRSTIVRTAWGMASMTLLHGIDVDVEGANVNVDVLFHPSSMSRALLGRQALLRAVEAGFTKHEWLWR